MQKETNLKGSRKTRAAGFYVMLVVAAMALLQAVIYYAFYQQPNLLRYYSQEAFVLPLIAVVACIVLSLFKATYKWAPIVLYGLELYAFYMFAENTYMYLSSAFFGGIRLEAILGLSPGFLLSAILYILILILGAFAVLMKARNNAEEAKK